MCQCSPKILLDLYQSSYLFKQDSYWGGYEVQVRNLHTIPAWVSHVVILCPILVVKVASSG